MHIYHFAASCAAKYAFGAKWYICVSHLNGVVGRCKMAYFHFSHIKTFLIFPFINSDATNASRVICSAWLFGTIFCSTIFCLVREEGTLMSGSGSDNGNYTIFYLNGGQGFLFWPGQTNIYFSDCDDPWECMDWIWRAQSLIVGCVVRLDVWQSRMHV